jgi:alpha-amylase
MLAYPYGYPKVMSSFDYRGDTDAGAPGVPVHNNGNLECFASNWKCEHRWSYISGAMQFRNATADNFEVTDWWSNGNNQIAFGRSDKGFVAINKEDNTLYATLPTSMAQGTYCNVLKGELSADGSRCSGETVTVNADGSVNLNVSAWDAVAIHHEARIGEIIDDNDNDDNDTTGFQRTVIFIEAQTSSGQDMFVRGGLDHGYASSALGLNCTASNYECAIPIRHNNLRNETTAPWKQNDSFLDWYGLENGQNSNAEGSALDWTTDVWPAQWGPLRQVSVDGYGQEPLNVWGQHQWMLDVEMDCSKTVNGWFELKAFVKNGQGWESDVSQANTPYSSGNHFAQCGKLNRFVFGQNDAVILDL